MSQVSELDLIDLNKIPIDVQNCVQSIKNTTEDMLFQVKKRQEYDNAVTEFNRLRTEYANARQSILEQYDRDLDACNNDPDCDWVPLSNAKDAAISNLNTQYPHSVVINDPPTIPVLNVSANIHCMECSTSFTADELSGAQSPINQAIDCVLHHIKVNYPGALGGGNNNNNNNNNNTGDTANINWQPIIWGIVAIGLVIIFLIGLGTLGIIML